MPLLELRILEIHSFPHFSLTPFNILSWKFAYYFVFLYYRSSLSFNILSWKFAYYFVFLYYRSSLSVVNLRLFLELCLFWNLEYCKYRFPHFSLTRFDILSWHFAHDFVFTVLQVNFECRQWASVSVGVMSLLGLRILEIHSFPHFSPAFFDILSWNFSYNFVSCTVDQVLVSSLCVCLALRPSIHFLHFPPTCIDKFSWI